MTRAQMKFFSRFVVFVDRPGIATAQLDRVRDNSREHRFEIQSRAYRPAHLVQSTKLIQSPLEFPRADLHFLFEVGVGLLELRSHAIELTGKPFQLVACFNLKTMSEITRTDPLGPGL